MRILHTGPMWHLGDRLRDGRTAPKTCAAPVGASNASRHTAKSESGGRCCSSGRRELFSGRPIAPDALSQTDRIIGNPCYTGLPRKRRPILNATGKPLTTEEPSGQTLVQRDVPSRRRWWGQKPGDGSSPRPGGPLPPDAPPTLGTHLASQPSSLRLRRTCRGFPVSVRADGRPRPSGALFFKKAMAELTKVHLSG